MTSPACRASLVSLSLFLAALTVHWLGGNEAQLSTPAQAERAPDIIGIWTRYDTGGAGDPVRFYYFHGDGNGLYRYGRVGRSNTHSFGYGIDGNDLALSFRKTGEDHLTSMQFEQDAGGETWLRFTDDPREPGARYRRLPPPGSAACEPMSADGPERSPDPSSAPPVAGRIWIDFANYRTGGVGFHMYQFNAAGIDGRGVGWFHRGDFDNWSTEALTFQVRPDGIDLHFTDLDESYSSSIDVERTDDGPQLTLVRDPRDFWHTHVYKDGGASFGLVPFGPILDTTTLLRDGIVAAGVEPLGLGCGSTPD